MVYFRILVRDTAPQVVSAHRLQKHQPQVSLDLLEESDPEPGDDGTNSTTPSPITASDADRRLRGMANSPTTTGVHRNLQDEVTVGDLK